MTKDNTEREQKLRELASKILKDELSPNLFDKIHLIPSFKTFIVDAMIEFAKAYHSQVDMKTLYLEILDIESDCAVIEKALLNLDPSGEDLDATAIYETIEVFKDNYLTLISHLQKQEQQESNAIEFYKFTRDKLSFKNSTKEVNESFSFFDKVNDGKGTASPEKMYKEFINSKTK